MTETPAAPPSTASTVAQLVRAACHLVVVIVVTIWGFVDWPAPWSWLTSLGFGVLAVLIWALFLSPRPVLHTDRFGRALIELLFIAAGVGALLAVGAHWIPALLFGVVGAGLGYLPERQR